MATCSVPGCINGGRIVRGLCIIHYRRWKRTGRFEPPKVTERFWTKVDKDGPLSGFRSDLGPCWIWTASTFGEEGYGAFAIAGETVGAHVYAYVTEVGIVPDGLELDHLCHVRSCVRPSHLEPVTPEENMRRQIHKGTKKTRCIRGHEFTPENTYVTKRGHRRCQTCHREDENERRRNQR
jgi:hypothetical protein